MFSNRKEYNTERESEIKTKNIKYMCKATLIFYNLFDEIYILMFVISAQQYLNMIYLNGKLI